MPALDGPTAPSPQPGGHASDAREREATVLALLPWLGVPVLAAKMLAVTGRPLPGEVLPVVAFLPLVVALYALAPRVPLRWRALALGAPGWLVLLALLAFLARDAPAGAVRTLLVAAGLTLASTLLVAWLGRARPRFGVLATVPALAMVFCQGLDGWQTYLAVDNPYGWLPDPAEERVAVSRFLLATVPWLYPVVKVGLGIGVAVGLARQHGPWLLLATLVVCYAGFSPAMFSAANLLAG